jgi:hypothetical protein
MGKGAWWCCSGEDGVKTALRCSHILVDLVCRRQLHALFGVQYVNTLVREEREETPAFRSKNPTKSFEVPVWPVQLVKFVLFEYVGIRVRT